MDARSAGGGFLAFLPHYFEGWYGFGGNFAWMGLHLWDLDRLRVLIQVARGAG